MKKEVALTGSIFGILFILTILFKPVFFLVTLIVLAIWFLLARNNGYALPSYIALILSISLFIIFAPADQSDLGISVESQAKTLAAPDLNSSNLVVSNLAGKGAGGIYLVADRNSLDKVVLVRPASQDKESYLLGDSKPKYIISSNVKQDLLNQFGEKNPLGYAFAFFLAILPLAIIAALPRKGSSPLPFSKEPAKDSPGQPIFQMILVVLIIFLIGTIPF